jgi:hypothetical protein
VGEDAAEEMILRRQGATKHKRRYAASR